MKRLLCLFIAVFFLCSCSSGGKKKMRAADLSEELRNAPLVIELFVARSFLGGTEYERYMLAGGVLWRECGAIAGKAVGQALEKLDGDELLPRDASLQLKERRAEAVSTAQQLKLKIRAVELFKVAALSESETPLPGSFASLSDPGLFQLKVALGKEKQGVITSVDAVADKDSAVLQRVYELTAALRDIGPAICGAKTFYGIGRKG